ncbi:MULTISPECIES: response regulator transcription factor [unclassified Luteibacter]|uniref:response regulator transcription factor n=1 Tax=unclassified Luteibacter TaxID=2620188 RepID=UPI0008B8EFD6|nr:MULTISPECIES: response regulator transcription factor [unclassified Luteibacter]MDR6935367.1 two-component system uhpT operon response regulator UhpA [Luteibacter sp. 3190]SEO75972.1 two-component system, NarL family, uhpT operon response regulator UhpA [Luteibacter sp. UNC138MFCol5.1]SEV96340.1 two component transcriptional regulator, LuxR family [Luteibacter sp. 329MFSha]
MPRIVLVDDHAIVREGFKRLIELEPDLDVVAEARNADEAVDAVTQHRPDLVAVDLSLPDGSGLPLIEHLGSIAPGMKIVVLSMHDGEPYVSEALRRGARGYVTKGVAPEELVAAVRSVLGGDQYLSSDLRERRSGRTTADLDPFNRLTAREREVFLLLAAGRAPKQVAAELGIGQKTIYIHRAAVMNKLNAGSELDLYRMAQERGLIRA